jgi:hypothetical protein
MRLNYLDFRNTIFTKPYNFGLLRFDQFDPVNTESELRLVYMYFETWRYKYRYYIQVEWVRSTGTSSVRLGLDLIVQVLSVQVLGTTVLYK